jgi:hypothetical protein
MNWGWTELAGSLLQRTASKGKSRAQKSRWSAALLAKIGLF